MKKNQIKIEGECLFCRGRIKQKRNVEIIVINFADSEHEGIEEIIKLRDIIYCVYEEKVRSLSKESREAFYFLQIALNAWVKYLLLCYQVKREKKNVRRKSDKLFLCPPFCPPMKALSEKTFKMK